MMQQVDYAEIVGYVGTVVVLLSFLNKNITRLRIINGVGCMLFIVAPDNINKGPCIDRCGAAAYGAPATACLSRS